MMDYEIRQITLKSRKKTKRKLLIDFPDGQYAPLAVFLETEVKNFAGEIAAALAENSVFRGNLCTAEFGGETVNITGGPDEEAASCRVSRADFAAVLADFEARLAAMRAEEAGEQQKTADFETIRAIIVRTLKYDAEQITPETLIRDLDANSMAIVELAMELEDFYHIEGSDSEIVPLKTVGDIVKYINARLKGGEK